MTRVMLAAGVGIMMLVISGLADPGELFPGRGEPAATPASQPGDVQISQTPPPAATQADPQNAAPASQPAVYNGVAELIRAMPEEWLNMKATLAEQDALVKAATEKFSGAILVLRPSECSVLTTMLTFNDTIHHPTAFRGVLTVRISANLAKPLARVPLRAKAVAGIRGTISYVCIGRTPSGTGLAITVQHADATFTKRPRAQ